MADATMIKWLYPPNFTGTFDDPSRGKVSAPRRYSVYLTNYSDGTGEDEELKIKRNDMRTTEGEVPSKLVIEKISYQVYGMNVRLSFNNANDEEIAILSDGSGEIDFTNAGGFTPMDDIDDVGGDVVLTSEFVTAGDNYSIKIDFRAKQ